MSRDCLVCNTPHLEMISILRHPRDLDSMLRSLLGLQANDDDYLCKSCCSEIRNAFDSKQKLYKFNQLESEVLGSDWTVIKDEVDPGDYIENVVSARDPVVNIEPQSDDLKEALKMIDGSTGTRCNEMFKSDFDLHLGAKLQPGADNEYKSEAQRTVWATVGGESDTTELKETRSSSSELQGAFNIVTPDAACIQSGSEDCLAYFKREKSVDIEENTREEKLDAEREDTIKTINSSESREVAVASGEKKLIFHCEVCNNSYLQISHFQSHFKREHPDIKITNTSLLQNPYKCSYCSKAFATNIKHQDHVRTHTKEKPYVFCERGKGFITPSKLKDNDMFQTGEKPFQCSESGNGFINSSDLKVHQRIHTGEKSYKCSYCSKCFATIGERYTHSRTHKNEKPHVCSECVKSFTTSSRLEYHKEKSVEVDDSTVENKPNTEREDIIKTVENSESEKVALYGGQAKLTFHCEVCNNSYCQIGSLQNHFKREHPNITIKKPFVCSECGKDFKYLSNLKVHQRVHTGEKPYKCSGRVECFTRSSKRKAHERIHTREKSYKCPYCDKCFATIGKRYTHSRTHFITSSRLEDHKRVHTGEKPYKCCTTSSQGIHIKTHTNDEKECEQNGSHTSKDCWEYFKREKSVEIDDSTVENKSNTEREDIKTVENSESEEVAVSGGQAKLTFHCEVCNNSYSQIVSLQNHFKREHPNITIKKPFVCSECGKCFKTSFELKIHNRIHTGEKPYKCLYCSKMFARSCVYQRHVKTHKNEKPYICCECGKGFASSYVLTVHKRTHTGEKPYKCSECGKCFTSSSNLKTHNRIHTGEKPYKCLYCSKTFAAFGACRVHMRTHTNERPYVCHECGKGFITSSGLKIHERTHTGEKPYK